MRNKTILILIAAAVCCAQQPSTEPLSVDRLQATLRQTTDPEVLLHARLQLVRLYQRQGDWWSAIHQLEAVKKLAPDDPEYAYQLGTLYNALSRSMFELMQSHAPQSARTKQLTAEQFAVLGYNDRAIQALHDAIKADPALEGSHLALAMLYMRMEKRQDAAAEIEQELRIAPQSAAARALKNALR